MKAKSLFSVCIFFVIACSATAQTAREWFNKGQAASDPAVKIQCFTKAIDMGCPFPSIAYNDRGAAKNKLGKYNEAIEDFDQSLKIKSDNPWAYANRGFAKNELGKHAEAVHDYNRSLKLEPRESKVWVNLGYAELAQKNVEKALADFDKAVEYNPEFAPAYNARGEAREKANRLKEALEDYKTAIRLDPNFAEAYNNRGYVYLQLKNAPQAVRDYDQSISLGGADYEPARKYREQAQGLQREFGSQSLPLVRWVSTTQRVEYKNFTVQACVESATALKETALFVNGGRQRGIMVSGGASCSNKVNQQVSLKEGENHIYIWAENAGGGGASDEIIVYYTPPQAVDRPGAAPGIGVERRIAMVVGNAVYPNGSSLLNPGNDARDMEVALTELAFKVLKYDNLSKQEMDKRIADFTDTLKNYDVGLFYYSGHGVEVNGNNYLLPVSVPAKMDKTDIEYNCVPADWLEEKMGAAGGDNKTFIVILDACRNNPFRSWRGTTKEAWAAPQSVPSGLITAFATSNGQTASDGTGNNGSYTSILLKYIRAPNLSIEELFRKVRVELKQTGQESVEMNKLMKGFYFNPQ